MKLNKHFKKIRMFLVVGVMLFSFSYFSANVRAEDDSADGQISLLELGAGEVIVYNYNDLKRALSENNGYTHIYLGGDIIQEGGGISIHPSKADVVIDGLAPEAPAAATFTQRGSDYLSNTIRVDEYNNGTRNISLQNMKIIGKNYYGAVAVHDVVSGVALTYKNIDYTGPQLTYNKNGSAHYIDSQINIAKLSGGSNAQEAAQAANIEFSGSVTIEASSSASSAIFWLCGSSTSMTVNSGAKVTANTNYYCIYADISSPVMSIQKGASFTYKGKDNGLLYSNQRLKSLHL